MPISVSPMMGHYKVYEWDGAQIKDFVVGRDGKCTCGGDRNGHKCTHIKAVIEHLKTGGVAAGQAKESLRLQPPIPERCPVSGCNGAVHPYRPFRGREILWECEKSKTHFWKARGGEAVKSFLLDRTHPNKLGPFYQNPFKEEAVCLTPILARLLNVCN